MSGIGIDALVHVRQRHGHLALAALPLILGVHQLIESSLWWSLEGHLPHSVVRVAMWLYLLIAFVLLPIYVPFAVRAIEETRRRRWMMAPFVVLGAGVAVVLLAAMIRGPVLVSLRPYHLSYGIKLSSGGVVVIAYVIAVCGALLVSGYRPVRWFGMVNLLAVGIIAILTIDGFASVWCGWAAISSAAVALRLRFEGPRRQPLAVS